ncbi:MAG: AAA family ATPase [Planctomycetota bacterium]|nr:AAA family ATPase [Planctomycetota bacterium]
MTHSDFATAILRSLAQPSSDTSAIAIDDRRRRNAGRCMTALACARLGQPGNQPEHVRHSLFKWNGGFIGLRNSRVADQFWTNLFPSVSEELHSLADKSPVAYLFLHWDLEQGVFHAWAVPEDIAFASVADVPRDAVTGRRTIRISPEDHQLKNSPEAPSFAPYYARVELSPFEREKLLEAIKTDDNLKEERLASELPNEAVPQDVDGEAPETALDDDDSDEVIAATYTQDTVQFILDLPDHDSDGAWHEKNKRRYKAVLRDPSQQIVNQLRAKYIQRLSPAVAGGKRHLSILNKNDYGKGGYHDHYWYAFYDPATGSKTKSVQLYVRFLGRERVWRYGLAMGNYCEEYLDRLVAVVEANRSLVAEYIRSAPADTLIRLYSGEGTVQLSPSEFAESLAQPAKARFGLEGPLTDIEIIREFSLTTLVDHAATFVDEVGEYFTWAWPFFEAAMTGRWNAAASKPSKAEIIDDAASDVDEDAPETLKKLAELTALRESFLEDLDEALSARQQAILVGPPGTSKTFVARQFARYFVRQRGGRPQGTSDVLYMHANWTYEDFFEGLKPTSKDGVLSFEPRLGFFLEWVHRLKDYAPGSRHVLVLDEINRCDTAAVLGELLQLLEYRGTTVRLLSGRSFVFPSNLFIIGTMNSADRSIGRLDLALRRRFLWLNLHSEPDTLARWLKRPGNNPLGFSAESLTRVNEVLEEHGIPPEQHIGHALFMLQRRGEDDTTSPMLDIPLSERRLRQIVRFSVVPYVRELLTMQFGQADLDLLRQIEDLLLECVDRPTSDASGVLNDGGPQA